MHGFLNVFLAAALTWMDRVKGATLETILDAQSADAFGFDRSGVSLHGRRLTTDEVVQARRCFALSFGSCSVDDPLTGLKALGLVS